MGQLIYLYINDHSEENTSIHNIIRYRHEVEVLVDQHKCGKNPFLQVILVG